MFRRVTYAARDVSVGVKPGNDRCKLHPIRLFWGVFRRARSLICTRSMPFDRKPTLQFASAWICIFWDIRSATNRPAFRCGNAGGIASEPDLTKLAAGYMLVDTASRPGMAGAPVIRRSWAAHLLNGDAQQVTSRSASAGSCAGMR